MMSKMERRRHPRTTVAHDLIGMVYGRGLIRGGREDTAVPISAVFLDIHNLSEGGALVESPCHFQPSSLLRFLAYHIRGNTWRTSDALAIHCRPSSSPGRYLIGLELLSADRDELSVTSTADAGLTDPSADLKFLIKTELLDSVPPSAVCQLLNCLQPKFLQTGERLFAQGDPGDGLYIVQEGCCTVSVEKNGEMCQVACLRSGDVVGEIAVLTGEPRSAQVVANCNMKLWELGKLQFEEVATAHPDLRYFLTELVTHRFESESVTSERTIGHYVIKSRAGSGGWSIVYRGAHKTLNLPVAIKMLKHVMAMEPVFLERFRSEAKIIAQMNHRNIVQVFDIEELYRTMFIIMEFLEGESLETLLRRLGRIPIARAVDFLVQTCQGLAYAHDKGIVHQDIKPANLFIQSQDQLKILDFGLACAPGSRDLNIAGTIHYAAPEQIEGDPVDVRTDVYALGIAAYEMITGVRPYPEDDLNVLVEARLSQDIPPPSLLVSDLPERMSSFITKACARNPENRYQNVWHALDDLEPLYEEYRARSAYGVLERRKMLNLVFLFQEEQQLALNRLLDDFSARVQNLGVVMKAASFENI